ncbi:MAG TPA: hypothetical protein VFQ45_22815 [Longimicrobium sp.]|nr:hypothetical protein [Longimicrobium sp.]
MTRRPAGLLAAAVVAVGVLVYAVGLAMTPERAALAAGVALGTAFQLLVLGIAVFAFPGNALAAYGVGLLGRLLLVVVAALVIVPATGVEPAPFLYSLVTVLFATTLLEPVVMAAGARNRNDR